MVSDAMFLFEPNREAKGSILMKYEANSYTEEVFSKFTGCNLLKKKMGGKMKILFLLKNIYNFSSTLKLLEIKSLILPTEK